jgi:hypothetical protein
MIYRHLWKASLILLLLGVIHHISGMLLTPNIPEPYGIYIGLISLCITGIFYVFTIEKWWSK